MSVSETKAKALAVAAAILDKKATDVLILHIAKLTSIADYLVIGSGESERQARAIADHVGDVLKAQGHPPLSIEGASSAKWVVMDFGDVIVHIFQKDIREHYALERLWGDAGQVKLPEERAVKVAPPHERRPVPLAPGNGSSMFRLLSTIFLVSVGIFLYSYFRELNPGAITVRTSPDAVFELSPVSLVLFSMALGATLVALIVTIKETSHVFMNWRTNRLVRRKEKVDALHRDGTHAFMSKRTADAVNLFERALVIDPNRTDSLLWLGNIYRSESNFTEAIRLHQQAYRIEERNVEVLLELAKDLEGARRYEEALQTLQNILRIEPDNLMALIRKRDLQIRLEKWSDALEIQHRLVKANLPESERRAEANLLLGCMYEVGRQLLERGHPDKARRYFRGAIKKDRTFLPAYIGIGEILVREGKIKNAVEILKKIYAKTRSVIILHRLEELFLELGEPDEIIRVYQEALQQDPHNAVIQFYLGKLYYRLEMVDEAYDVLSTLDGTQEQLVDYHKIMANLYLRKQHMDEAVGELKKALGFKKRVVVPYQCTQCHHELAEWSGRCRRCGRWNTYVALPWRDSAKSGADQDGLAARLPVVPYQGIASPFETV